MINIILYTIAAGIMWHAVHVGRNQESELVIFSKDWWIALICLTTGFVLFKSV